MWQSRGKVSSQMVILVAHNGASKSHMKVNSIWVSSLKIFELYSEPLRHEAEYLQCTCKHDVLFMSLLQNTSKCLSSPEFIFQYL